MYETLLFCDIILLKLAWDNDHMISNIESYSGNWSPVRLLKVIVGTSQWRITFPLLLRLYPLGLVLLKDIRLRLGHGSMTSTATHVIQWSISMHSAHTHARVRVHACTFSHSGTSNVLQLTAGYTLNFSCHLTNACAKYVDHYGDSTKDVTPLYHAFCLFIINEYFVQLKCYQLQI